MSETVCLEDGELEVEEEEEDRFVFRAMGSVVEDVILEDGRAKRLTFSMTRAELVELLDAIYETLG